LQNLVNISIDDVSPHPKSSIKVVDRCFELIKVFPDIKFSLFVPISYWRTQRVAVATKEPLQINLFPDFCNFLRNLPDKNFEVCYHGFYHGIPGHNDNDEFQNMNFNEAKERFDAMFEVVKLANLENKFKKIFRPPAWRMSSEAIKAARSAGFNVLALSPDKYAKLIYKEEDTKKADVVYYNCAPPFKHLSMYEKTEIVYHACEWDNNFLCKQKSESLIQFLKKNRQSIEFRFLAGMI